MRLQFPIMLLKETKIIIKKRKKERKWGKMSAALNK